LPASNVLALIRGFMTVVLSAMLGIGAPIAMMAHVASANPSNHSTTKHTAPKSAADETDAPILIAKGGGGGGGGAGGGGGGAGGGAGGAGGGAGGAGGSGGGGSGGAGGSGGTGSSGGAAGAGGGTAGGGGAAGPGGAPGAGGGVSGGGDGAASGGTVSPTPTSDVVLAKAQQDLARGDFNRALAGAETVVRSNAPASQRASALLVAGDAAFALRNYARASAHYTAFLSSYRTLPDAPRAAMARGWAKFREGDAGHAHWTWSYAADEFPRDARAPLALILAAGVANKAGDRTSAAAALDRLLANYPRSPYVGTALLHCSLLALDRGDENAAVRQLGDVIRTSGTAAVQDHATIASAFATPGAEAALEPASGRPPLHGDSLERFATAIIDTGEPQTTAPMLHGVALVAATERGWTDPLVDSLANRLFDNFPSYGAASALLIRVAAAAASAGSWQVATRDYEKVVARYGDAPAGRRARLELAEAFVHVGALSQAREHVRRAALAGGEESPRAWLRLAEISQMMGDRHEALAAYERVPRTMPRTPESLLSQARLLKEGGQAVSARLLPLTAAQTSKGERASEAAYELGRLAGERGQHETALEWFTNALSAEPDSPWSRLALLGTGDSLAALGRKPEALAAYTKLLAAVPADAWRRSPAHAAVREVAGEAAYRGGKLLRTAGRHGEALNMFIISALFTKGSPAETRALVGVVQCLVATGDRNAAEGLYRQLQASGAGESMLAEARRALDTAGADSALPRGAR
jgi:tetratricopeptide (TPR) repeat protein